MACKLKTFKKTLFILLLLWAYPSLVMAVTPPIPAHPSQYVVDLAGVLDADTRAFLNNMLQDLEAKTTAQVVVLTINSLEGEPIESFSHQTAVKWGIGQKGKDNGVLITVAVKDRKYRIEVGYGLESTLPDSLVGSIGRKYLVPHFRKGDFAGGIEAAVAEIIATISPGTTGTQAGEATGGGEGDTTPKAETTSGNASMPGLIFIILFVIIGLGALAFFIPRLIKRASGGVWFSGGGDSGWSSGGGGSDFGDSGFSGGGGDFGGGGASGDW